MSMRTTVLNCPVDVCNINEAINRANSALLDNQNFQIITINPEMIMYAQKNKDFFDILNASSLNIVDGVGVRIALKLQNITTHRIRGIDFSRAMVEFAAKNNLSIGLLGAQEDVIQQTKKNFLEKYPNLNIVYLRNGFFDNDEEIIEQIKAANPKILLVGAGSPKQEEIICKLKNVLQGSIMIGVGGSFDVFANKVKEAPEIYRKLGLEWLFRTILQPERFRRIFPTLPIFLLKCIIDSVKKGCKIEKVHQ